MKRLSAFLLAFFVLLLSTESSIDMHFCHDVLVETSINQTLSSCCKKAAKHDQPTLTKQCCEIAHFDLETQDSVIASSDVIFTELVVFFPVTQFELNTLEHTLRHQFISFEYPPKLYYKSLYSLFEQYLI